MLKRIKNEIKAVIWLTPKKAFKELGTVTIVSLLLMSLAMVIDNFWNIIITFMFK